MGEPGFPRTVPMRKVTLERHTRILAELQSRRHATVGALAAGLSVSDATVRRDLRHLAEQGRVRLVHGGATLPQSRAFSFREKQLQNVEAKRVIAELAARLVEDGDVVFLDSGSTCFEMVAPLAEKQGLTVLVNSVRLAGELHGSGLGVILVGGQYRPERVDTVGPIALQAVDELRGYVAFLGADGLSMDGGPAAVDIESADLFRRVAGNARETILVVDHGKFESAALYRVVEWSRVRRLITDREPEEEWRRFLSEQEIEVVFPGSSGDEK